MVLKGEKVILRVIEPSDLDIILNWENDSRFWYVSDTLVPYSKHIIEQFVNTSQDIYTNKQLRFIICLQENNNPIGLVDIFDFDGFHKRAGIGVMIKEGENRGKGYASEALGLVKEYCFSVLCLKQIFCNVLEENDESLRLFKAKGFEIVGLKKAWRKSSAGFKNEYMLQMINDIE
jgi:diamine N-acetyltransferase